MLHGPVADTTPYTAINARVNTNERNAAIPEKTLLQDLISKGLILCPRKAMASVLHRFHKTKPSGFKNLRVYFL